MLEDVVEGVLAGDASTEDAVEGIDDGVEVFGNQVATEMRLETIDDVQKGLMGFLHSFVMTLVGEDDIALRLRQTGGLDEHLAQLVEALGVLGAEEEKTPSILRTPSIPRTAGAEYLLRGMTCGSKSGALHKGERTACRTLVHPPKQGD